MAAVWLSASVAVLASAGCAGAPSQDDLADSILAAAGSNPTVDLSEEEAVCMAQMILEADLSERTLNGLVENFDQPTVLAAEQDKIGPLVTNAAITCAQ